MRKIPKSQVYKIIKNDTDKKGDKKNLKQHEKGK
jgi:hypothetical protein|tara:strand:- start:3149 stop:3250 length:102 start_codon:yes stop_codon:yes gene_type:complete